MSIDDLRVALNTEVHGGTYNTPLGAISFDKDHDLVQKDFYVAQIKMNPGWRDRYLHLPLVAAFAAWRAGRPLDVA